MPPVTTGTAAGTQTFDSNGVQIAYREAGEATGTPVVLVHGFLADNRTQWDSPAANGPKVVKALVDTKKYRIVLLDSRGHGKSEKPVDKSKYGAEMAEDVDRLMKHLSIDKAHVVGYSMGAWVAQKFAADHPDKVRSLTVGGAGLFDDDDEANLKLIALALKNYADDAPESDIILKAALKNRLPLPNKADIPALLAAAGGASGLKLTGTQPTSYPGPVLGLVGKIDPARESALDLQRKRKAAGKDNMTVPDNVPGTHLSAPAEAQFSTHLVQFLGDN